MTAPRALVVNAEPPLLRALAILMRGAGYVVEVARTTSETLAAVTNRLPDALLLDLSLPDGQATEVCREVRRFSGVPILLMSAIGAERERVRALDAGADDYLPTPFRAGELLRQLNRILAESAGTAASPRVEIGELVIDLVRRRVSRAGAALLLEPTEFELVCVLAQRPGRIVTDRELLRAVWGDRRGQETRRLRLAVARLRSKLERDPWRPAYVIAEPGIGYRLCAPSGVTR